MIVGTNSFGFGPLLGTPAGNVGKKELLYANSLKTGDITLAELQAGNTSGVNVPGVNITANGLQILNTAPPKASAGGVTPFTAQVTFVKLLELGRTSLNRFNVKYKAVFGGTVNSNHRYVGFGQLGEGLKTPQNGGFMTCGSTAKSRTFEWFTETTTLFTDSITDTTVLEIDAYQWDKQMMIISKVNGVTQPIYKGSIAMENDAKGRTPGHWGFYVYGGDLRAVYDLEIWDLSGQADIVVLGNSIFDQWGLFTNCGQWNFVNQLQQNTDLFIENYARSSSIARDYILCAKDIARKAKKRVIFPFGANEIGGNLVPVAQAVIDYENLANAILAEKPSLEIVILLMPCAFATSIKPFNDAITTWANGRGFEAVPVWPAVQAADNSTTMFPNYANDVPNTHVGFIGQNAMAKLVVDNYIHIIQ